MFRIDGHFEGVLSEINFRDIDPLAVDVVFVDVITSNRNSYIGTGSSEKKARAKITS